MDINELAPTLKTGDVFLFRGTAEISHIIEKITGSPYSHIAMVFRVPTLPEDKQLHFWQSTPPKVDMWPLDLRQYPGKIEPNTFVCRRLIVERTPKMMDDLHNFIEESIGTKFPTDLEMAAHWLEGQFNINSGEETFFCAQLVAETFMQMGVLSKKHPANFYSPKDFSEAYHRLHLTAGATLGPEIVVTLPPA